AHEMTFVMADRHSDLRHHSFSIFSRHLKRPTAALISSASGVGRQPPKPPPGGWQVIMRLSFF
ncbi:hypothetical protein, partial [Rhizobium leguminosarum]|uniref:hypothetical protein n=1 Tax=Rhizobium leguminosarum TaxID=384 RepID=UPI0019534A7C